MVIHKVDVNGSKIYFKVELETKRTKKEFIDIWKDHVIFKSLREREKMLGLIYKDLEKESKVITKNSKKEPEKPKAPEK